MKWNGNTVASPSNTGSSYTGLWRATALAVTDALAGAFEVFLTGEKHWIEPDTVTAAFAADQVLTFTLALSGTAEAVVDYQPAVHGYAYPTGAPVVQLLLRGDRPDLGYLDLADVVVRSVSVAV